jgi:hypothetical protein
MSRLLKTMMTLALLAILSLGGGKATLAQEVPGLADAIAAGDTAAINNIVAANQNNPVVLAAIANALFAAAQATQNTNPTTAALFAAIAVNTGALPPNLQVIALNIVGSNPSALALLTNPNAPNTGGNFVQGNNNPPNNPANNSAQQCSSCN